MISEKYLEDANLVTKDELLEQISLSVLVTLRQVSH